jgi:hypothetical protein
LNARKRYLHRCAVRIGFGFVSLGAASRLPNAIGLHGVAMREEVVYLVASRSDAAIDVLNARKRYLHRDAVRIGFGFVSLGAASRLPNAIGLHGVAMRERVRAFGAVGGM